MFNKAKQGLVISVSGGDKELKPGAAAVLAVCGKAEERASAKACADKSFNWFEAYPMFRIEPSARAINCSPYSHSHTKPNIAATRQTAQEFCAKDKKCVAYNWVGSQGEA